jgi:hypothetical protein
MWRTGGIEGEVSSLMLSKRKQKGATIKSAVTGAYACAAHGVIFTYDATSSVSDSSGGPRKSLATTGAGKLQANCRR